MSFDYYPILSVYITALYTCNTALAIIAAVLLDALLGEPKRWHPLVGFGWLANWIEHRLNRHMQPLAARMIGLLSWMLLLAPLVAIGYFATHSILGWLADVLLLYFAIGARSLMQHAQQIYAPLSQHNLDEARHAISMIVSRDTSQLNETEIATATVESVLENGNDAIFGAIFWFALLGGTGALLFRLANTLDAMWGYRTPRFNYFGWAAARLDDLLNLIPARLTALSYALCGNTRNAIKCWATQAGTWYSPNAGPVMAAGAGALQVKLGGAATYHGTTKQRPVLGMGNPATASHILSAMRLVKHSLLLWCAVIALAAILRNTYFA
ncbi:MAG: cobalamin biosynthesis protein [Methylotenera sp.]|nr:cobalamin biosynthesis protein [Methylotenera sp.]